jgi:hypothetical protein
MLRIFPKKRKWYLKDPDNEIDRRFYRYYEVFKRVFWRVYKMVGIIKHDDLVDKDVDQVLTSKFCPKEQ